MTLITMIWLCCALLLLLVITQVSAQKVQTKYGWVNGYSTATHKVWMGIPYAAPPVGKLRWAAPQFPTAWEGVKQTTQKTAICPQPNPSRNSSEDCLSLNIYTPINATKPLPVYFFIHGGSFWGGNGADFEGEFLSGTDMLFVSINYRLGSLGFLGTPELLAASPTNSTGFYGVQDQRSAMIWVQQNIAAFGGDPNKITIGGQSAGAISVCTHIATRRSKGLFQRAIMESGECTINTLETVFGLSAEVVKNLNCTGTNQLSCLYGKTANEIVNASTGPIWPAVHDYELTQQPIDVLRSGSFNKVSLLGGTNHDEQSFEACPWWGSMTDEQYPSTLAKIYPSSIVPSVEKLYPVANYNPPIAAIIAAWSDSRFKCPTLEAFNAISAASSLPNYMYSFNYVPSWQHNKCLNVTHSTELGFLYPNPSFYGFTPAEKQLSYIMREWWSSFVVNGNPSSSTSNVTWNTFDNSTLSYNAINIPTISMMKGFEEPYCDFWAHSEPGLL